MKKNTMRNTETNLPKDERLRRNAEAMRLFERLYNADLEPALAGSQTSRGTP